ncbi:MAG TPA: hypothetical protein VHO72_06230, partial [Bacteroidales bacterium]|nr:hypothetical protein [Bacteroidales bacterium]
SFKGKRELWFHRGIYSLILTPEVSGVTKISIRKANLLLAKENVFILIIVSSSVIFSKIFTPITFLLIT